MNEGYNKHIVPDLYVGSEHTICTLHLQISLDTIQEGWNLLTVDIISMDIKQNFHGCCYEIKFLVWL